jgi:hypothetical protein
MEIGMRKERVEAAEQVAQKLFAAEAAIDSALKAAAELSAVLPTARVNGRVSAVVGQDAFESAAAALSALVSARNELITTHGALDRVKGEVGLRTLAFGGGFAKPLQGSHLELVESNAA